MSKLMSGVCKCLFQGHFFIGKTNQSVQIVALKQNAPDLRNQQMKRGDGKRGEWKLTNVRTVGKMKDTQDTIILKNCLVIPQCHPLHVDIVPQHSWLWYMSPCT